MCGIVGFVDASAHRTPEELNAIVQSMMRQLSHRGPDDEGAVVDGENGLALGFRRLSIQDLSANGNQPMTSVNDRYVIVYNGETYNFLDLKNDLERAGWRNWRGSSDTEVLLAAASRVGIAGMLDRADGMFAFALWDRQSHRLHLARDRMGEKPLYYGWSGGSFMFASELKAFAVHPEWAGRIDHDAFRAFMRYGYVPSPMSIYEGVFKLPAGHWLSLDLDALEPGKLPKPRAYWDSKGVVEREAADLFVGGLDEAVDELEERLTRSVERRMIADVPLGAFLSGGVDSSTVVALMQKVADRPVKTFTIGFAGSKYDESEAASAVAAHLGTDHMVMQADPQAPLEVVPRLSEIYDEPFADKSQLPTVLLAAMTRDHVTTALSGDGGDELFGGYQRYGTAAAAWARLARLSSVSRGAAGWLRDHTPLRLMNRLSTVGGRRGRLGDKLFRGLSGLQQVSPEAVLERSHRRWNVTDPPVRTEPGPFFADSSQWPDLGDATARLMYADCVTYLPDDLLVKIDRATMAVALEARAPLLSREIVEFAWSLPTTFKIAGGEQKRVLRRLAARYLPADLLDRPKQGFEPPLADWLRGPLREWADDLLQPSKLEFEGLVDTEIVTAAWEEHRNGHRDRNGDLWPVLVWQAWRGRWH